ncbi:MAG: SCO family protein [Gammaproteobacteria bacterium]|nr:SCO family protein [Gammaproteobacteria bacterium]
MNTRFIGPMALALVAACNVHAAPDPAVAEANPPRAIADFTLTDQAGKAFRFGQLRGKPVLVFFGFTHCPSACPSALAKLKAVAGSGEPGLGDLRIVMISTDGDRDTPAVMKKYLAAISPDFIGLTGPPRAVTAVANQFAAVFFRMGAADATGNYLVQHSDAIYLLDRAGRLRATFQDAPVATLARVTGGVAREAAPLSHK